MKDESLKEPASPSLPLVSVIVPVWNAEKYISPCLQSILDQEYGHFELIVVNDGSSDASPRIIESFIEKNPDKTILYHSQENAGPSKAINQGLRMSKGEFISCLGSDDLHLKNFLSDAVAALLRAGPEVCSVYTDGFVIDDQENQICRWSDRAPTPWGKAQYKELLVTNWLPVAGLLHRRTALLEMGPFDEASRNEDYHMWLRLARKYRFKALPKMGFCYRIHGKNRSAGNEHAARTIFYLTTQNSDLRKYLNFVWALLRCDLLTAFRRFSFFNLGLLGRTFLRRIQIILRGKNPVTITVRRQWEVLEIVARNYSQKLWEVA